MTTSSHLADNNHDAPKKIEMSLPVLVFEDDQCTFIAYIPWLDLSGYGSTIDEAKESIDIVLNDYLAYAIENNTLQKDLLDHGFTYNSEDHSINAPDWVQALKDNPELAGV